MVRPFTPLGLSYYILHVIGDIILATLLHISLVFPFWRSVVDLSLQMPKRGRKQSGSARLQDVAVEPPRRKPRRSATVTSAVVSEDHERDALDAESEHPSPVGDLPNQMQVMQQQIAVLQQTMMDFTAKQVSQTTAAPRHMTPRAESGCNIADTSSAVSASFGGETQPLPCSENMRASVPLGSFVDGKLKDKIGASQYVDLALLLAPAKDTVTLSLDHNTHKPSFSIDEKATRKIEGIYQWTSAFLIYMAIYIESHPSQASSMLQYMHSIRAMASSVKPASWLNYDQEFRKYRAIVNHPWEAKHQDLYLDAVMSGSMNSLVATCQFIP